MTTDESGELDGAVNEKQAPRWLLSTLNISSVGDVLKYSAIAGAIIYACLFLGYRKYYSLLGIRTNRLLKACESDSITRTTLSRYSRYSGS